MCDIKRLGLEPISAEELEKFYGCSGNGISCPQADQESGYNSDCCWHDCRVVNTNKGTKFWTAWN